MIAQLTSFKKTSTESIVDYLSSADNMQYNLTLVNEGISEKMFFSIILIGLSKEYENFALLEKYNKDEKSLEKTKQDLINFDNEKTKRKRRAYFSIKKGNVSTARKRDISLKTVGLRKHFMKKPKLPQ